ncbi:hypothetical protein JTB14_034475 [Gonioctena quinquepunctata]|nr:hypothetical protein JTB14_034475 [Gonioctena quinquepunctata]
MVKPRVKKTTRGEIPQELYEQAAYDVINGNAKVRTTAKKYGMCHISLRRFVIAKKNNKNPQQVRPLPKADFSKPKGTTSRRKGKTAIITDTPEKQLLEELYNNRKVSSAKKTLWHLKNWENKNAAKKRKIVEKSSEESSEDDTICLICCGPYCSSKEDWLQCRKCQGWAHSSCAKNDPLFVCNNCESSDSN